MVEISRERQKYKITYVNAAAEIQVFVNSYKIPALLTWVAIPERDPDQMPAQKGPKQTAQVVFSRSLNSTITYPECHRLAREVMDSPSLEVFRK